MAVPSVRITPPKGTTKYAGKTKTSISLVKQKASAVLAAMGRSR